MWMLASTKSQCDDRDTEDDVHSNNKDSTAPQRQPHRNVHTEKMKDVRELFEWKDD
jgi:hypothetical protein